MFSQLIGHSTRFVRQLRQNRYTEAAFSAEKLGGGVKLPLLISNRITVQLVSSCKLRSLHLDLFAFYSYLSLYMEARSLAQPHWAISNTTGIKVVISKEMITNGMCSWFALGIDCGRKPLRDRRTRLCSMAKFEYQPGYIFSMSAIGIHHYPLKTTTVLSRARCLRLFTLV